VLAYNYARFDPKRLLEVLVRYEVTTLCAPPTVWRLLVQEDLRGYKVKLREILSAGEPLNPEIIRHVSQVWGLTIRDFYGQTETTALVGNTPGQQIRPGSMGRPLPGYEVALLDPDGALADEGEICIALEAKGVRPVGVMTGYRDDPQKTAEVTRAGYYHTGDTASRDADGFLTSIGRVDDVFKASDYRISPFELESILIEHPAVTEAAVVPSPDSRRNAVPKAYVLLASGQSPSAELAKSILDHSRSRLAPYKRVRRLEFADLPKTISGKIRRVELRRIESAREGKLERRPNEYWQEDFPA
jgi:acetyl-CoA synthetase